MELQTARGVRDIPPEEMILKNKVVNTLKEIFELYGFAPLETPVIERYETLAAKFGAGASSDVLKETFILTDQGKRKLGLRFELTTSLARYVAMNPNLKLPFKRYEMGPVFRDGPIKLGRVRQFWQCDVDTIGTKSMLADAEIIAVLQTVFNKLKLKVVVKVNNRKLLNGILEEAKIKNKEEAIIVIDKLNKIGNDGVTEELKEKGVTAKQIELFFSLVKENITLNELKSKVTNEEGKEGINELEELFNYLKNMGVDSVVFDISLARGLTYYTGTVFEVFAKKGKITSSLAGGGRWDDMVGNFMGGNREVPAVGVAFGLVPIMEVLKEKENVEQKTPAKIYVIPINTVKESLGVVQELRKNGISTNFSLGKKGVSKNLQYANSLGIPYTIILGEEELKKKKVVLRNMKSGQEQLLTVKQIVKKIKSE
ncbi:MAG: histidine--tRNA ligase [Nanoarchaeota archaeon]|nr:histidine--tRNA ligase [Nanoarchaeota archaeon]MBU1632017.1 histidine--tRNA ligase [Nanoarchaeota archaeon]MBU1876203.1 histidine--tRNA ligase [Nanoarchaeota archaeon]